MRGNVILEHALRAMSPGQPPLAEAGQDPAVATILSDRLSLKEGIELRATGRQRDRLDGVATSEERGQRRIRNEATWS